MVTALGPLFTPTASLSICRIVLWIRLWGPESLPAISICWNRTTLLWLIGKAVALWRFSSSGPASLGRSPLQPANTVVVRTLSTSRRGWFRTCSRSYCSMIGLLTMLFCLHICSCRPLRQPGPDGACRVRERSLPMSLRPFWIAHLLHFRILMRRGPAVPLTALFGRLRSCWSLTPCPSLALPPHTG